MSLQKELQEMLPRPGGNQRWKNRSAESEWCERHHAKAQLLSHPLTGVREAYALSGAALVIIQQHMLLSTQHAKQLARVLRANLKAVLEQIREAQGLSGQEWTDAMQAELSEAEAEALWREGGRSALTFLGLIAGGVPFAHALNRTEARLEPRANPTLSLQLSSGTPLRAASIKALQLCAALSDVAHSGVPEGTVTWNGPARDLGNHLLGILLVMGSAVESRPISNPRKAWAALTASDPLEARRESALIRALADQSRSYYNQNQELKLLALSRAVALRFGRDITVLPERLGPGLLRAVRGESLRAQLIAYSGKPNLIWQLIGKKGEEPLNVTLSATFSPRELPRTSLHIHWKVEDQQGGTHFEEGSDLIIGSRHYALSSPDMTRTGKALKEARKALVQAQEDWKAAVLTAAQEAVNTG